MHDAIGFVEHTHDLNIEADGGRVMTRVKWYIEPQKLSLVASLSSFPSCLGQFSEFEAGDADSTSAEFLLNLHSSQPMAYDPPTMMIREFEADGVSYRLARPLMVDVYHKHNIITCANEDLHLYGYGATRKEAIEELQAILVTLYRSYKQTPVENLTEDAKRFRQQLCQLFEEPFPSTERWSFCISTHLSDLHGTTSTTELRSPFASGVLVPRETDTFLRRRMWKAA